MNSFCFIYWVKKHVWAFNLSLLTMNIKFSIKQIEEINAQTNINCTCSVQSCRQERWCLSKKWHVSWFSEPSVLYVPGQGVNTLFWLDNKILIKFLHLLIYLPQTPFRLTITPLRVLIAVLLSSLTRSGRK